MHALEALNDSLCLCLGPTGAALAGRARIAGLAGLGKHVPLRLVLPDPCPEVYGRKVSSVGPDRIALAPCLTLSGSLLALLT
jgi:hypothetical protein